LCCCTSAPIHKMARFGVVFFLVFFLLGVFFFHFLVPYLSFLFFGFIMVPAHPFFFGKSTTSQSCVAPRRFVGVCLFPHRCCKVLGGGCSPFAQFSRLRKRVVRLKLLKGVFPRKTGARSQHLACPRDACPFPRNSCIR